MSSVTLTEPGQAADAAQAAQASVQQLRRLELPAYDLDAAIRLERELGVSHVIAQILVRRGYAQPDAARAFLDAAERYEPSRFAGIDAAIELVRRHVLSGSRIVVHGDYDVDGVCATAVMVRALRSIGGQVGWYLPSRSEDGYGLATSTVERLCRSGAGLLVSVDCGITAVEQVELARVQGLDVLITDHHAARADGVLPDCPLVHPGLCHYPSPDLCGTAVAHKLAEALGAGTATEDLELVALATVADQVPLQGENRRLVREGLLQMAATRRPGLRALMRVSRTDPSALDASCLAFRLAPRINAAGRMRRADAGLELLLTDDAERAAEIAAELDTVNGERRATEQRIAWEAELLAERMGERSSYVLAAAGWHPGVIGIVASRIVSSRHRPVVMLAIDPADPGAAAHGSARSIPGFDLLAALQATASHLITYGGHRAAAGLSIAPQHIAGFADALECYAAAALTPAMLAPDERADAVLSPTEVSLSLAEELQTLAPFGNANPEPRLYVPAATFEAVRSMGDAGQHVRFSLTSGAARASAVAFGYASSSPGLDGQRVDASFALQRNVWNGVVEPRLVLAHAVPCQPAEIAVRGEPADYLAAVWAELDRRLPESHELTANHQSAADGLRTVVDRRGCGALATIADAQSACGPGQAVLVVCADTPRRLAGLAGRGGGFALISHEALADEPQLAAGFQHIVVIDPPASPPQDLVIRSGSGYIHLSWGEAELRFAEQMHELGYVLRTSLGTLYKALRERGRVAGGELEQLLRGDSRQPRPARLSGRLVRVLTELELVSLDRDLPAIAVARSEPTELERSAAYRAYIKVNEDGQRFLSGLQARRSG